MDSPGTSPLNETLRGEWLVGAVAHDLKAPLLAIQSYVAALASAAKQGDWGKVETGTAQIEKICVSVRQMLDDLQELASPKVGPAIETEQVDLLSVVTDLMSQLRLDHQPGLSMAVGQLPVVYGRRIRWQRMLQNLLENALRAVRDQPRPVVDIGSVPTATGEEIVIRDNGTGFETADVLVAKGALLSRGLGLLITDHLAQLQGVCLTLESPGPGQGTIARILVPRERIVPTAAELTPQG